MRIRPLALATPILLAVVARADDPAGHDAKITAGDRAH